VKSFGFERAAENPTDGRFVLDYQHSSTMPDGTVGIGRSCGHVAPAGSGLTGA
jgi:hypothetical protein